MSYGSWEEWRRRRSELDGGEAVINVDGLAMLDPEYVRWYNLHASQLDSIANPFRPVSDLEATELQVPS